MENRKDERIKSLLKAKIVFNHRMTTFDCVVKNVSRYGAKVAIDPAVSFPNEFELEIPLKGKSYHAKMRWRDRESMGVEFLDQMDQREPGNAQFERLQAENHRLKAAVLALSKKLEDIGQDVPKYF